MAESLNGDRRPRILFIGAADSTHTHSWIELLRGSEFDVRIFALPGGKPPTDWSVVNYLCDPGPCPASNSQSRIVLNSWPRFAGRIAWLALGQSFRRSLLSQGRKSAVEILAQQDLKAVLSRFRPQVVQTLGLHPAAELFHAVTSGSLPERLFGKWVLQLRGGSDLELSRLDPHRRPAFQAIFAASDVVLTDNEVNFGYITDLGLTGKVSSLGTVPGTGGVDVEALSARWKGLTSSRRLILWPKAYECPWSKSLPVLEALRLCWTQLQPFRLRMLAADGETREWFRTLPDELQTQTEIHERIPRELALQSMAEARILLAPSLVDGTPNSMFEAMALGAVPILSPLKTITPVVESRKNVLFARNLYPTEIAEALVTAMHDDRLVDDMAAANLVRVRSLADRAVIRPRVLAFYRSLLDDLGKEW